MKYLSNVVTLQYDRNLCDGCETCTQVCPHGVFVMEGKGKAKKALAVDRDACMECGACALNCKAGALTVDSGVGCAQAFINAALGRKGECCCEGKGC
jgi:NAD-dependent dihydropyrimidine dehydrogenase PreA subunit